MPKIPMNVLNANATMPLKVNLLMLVKVTQSGANIPFRKTRRRNILARKVEKICVSCGIADGGDIASFACI